MVTQIGASTCALVWVFLSWKRNGKPTITAIINGAISGLAGVTPAAGFISGQHGFILGIVLGFASYYGIVLLKEKLKIDDALDVSSVHGITGIVGSLAIGIFASQAINPAGPVGWLYSGSPMQLIIQGVGVAVAAVMAFVGTFVILKIIDYVIGLRVNEDEEDLGLDVTQHAETGYSDNR